MRYVLISTFVLVAGLATPAMSGAIVCNTAVQNWQNGSLTTCPYGGGGGGLNKVRVTIVVPFTPPPPPLPPPPIEEEEEDVF